MKKLLIVLLIVGLLVPFAAPVSADTVYVVQRGDTLYSIALHFGVTVQAILNANGLSNPNLIFVGQTLTIPTGGGSSGGNPPPAGGNSTYVVQPGDYISLIARRFGVTVGAILAANNISNPNVIYAGQVLVIPNGGGSSGGNPTPVPTTPPSSTPSAPSSGGSYVVQRGDTLNAIARRFGVTVAAIMSANSISNPNLIFVGQILTIPGSGGGGGNPTPVPTNAPPPPPPPSGSWELGGQVSNFSAPDRMKYAGMFWVKLQLKWSPSATANDSQIVDAHNKGFKILLSVVGAPADVSGGANFDNYAAYVGELARLGADAIEVWNEMNLDREWPAGQINPVTYTDLLKKSYQAIKAKNANTLVISGALSPTGAEGAFGLDHVWNDSRYIAGLASAGAAAYMDCIGIHYNEGIISPTQTSGDPRDNYYTRYYAGMVNTYYNAFGGAKKLCFTELGYLSPEGYGPLPGNFGWAGNTSAAEQAQWLGEAANLAKNSGKVRLLIVFNVDFTLYGDDPQGGYAIIRPGDTCPACDSLRAVTGGR